MNTKVSVILLLFAAAAFAATCDPPCQNGGNCQPGNACLCQSAQWTGSRCEIPICNEAGGGCGPGNCTAPETCECEPGWTGKYCTTPVCDPPCQNGGQCVGVNSCKCTSDYTSALCDVAVCNPPCENGGICVSPGVCNCTGPNGWHGDHCEIAACNMECLHGGYCSGPDQCNCDNTGYAGAVCEVDINECLATVSPCDSRTSCINSAGGYNCTKCPSGYTGSGKKTEGGCKDINECASSEYCDPNAECTNTNGSYVCGNCKTGYTGDGKTGCSAVCSSTCVHGTCTAPNTCTCESGWTGATCNTPGSGTTANSPNTNGDSTGVNIYDSMSIRLTAEKVLYVFFAAAFVFLL